MKRFKRLTETGPVELNLLDELNWMIKLFYGAFCQSSLELGIPVDSEFDLLLGEAECQKLLSTWYSSAASNDADLSQDVRMMVPVFYDAERGLIKVWLFMGWTESQVQISFRDIPELIAINGKVPDTHEYDIVYAPTYKRAAYPAFAEVYVSRLLNRDEFRAHCDRHRSIEQIISNLPGAQVTSAVE